MGGSPRWANPPNGWCARWKRGAAPPPPPARVADAAPRHWAPTPGGGSGVVAASPPRAAGTGADNAAFRAAPVQLRADASSSRGGAWPPGAAAARAATMRGGGGVTALTRVRFPPRTCGARVRRGSAAAGRGGRVPRRSHRRAAAPSDKRTAGAVPRCPLLPSSTFATSTPHTHTASASPTPPPPSPPTRFYGRRVAPAAADVVASRSPRRLSARFPPPIRTLRWLPPPPWVPPRSSPPSRPCRPL